MKRCCDTFYEFFHTVDIVNRGLRTRKRKVQSEVVLSSFLGEAIPEPSPGSLSVDPRLEGSTKAWAESVKNSSEPVHFERVHCCIFSVSERKKDIRSGNARPDMAALPDS